MRENKLTQTANKCKVSIQKAPSEVLRVSWRRVSGSVEVSHTLTEGEVCTREQKSKRQTRVMVRLEC